MLSVITDAQAQDELRLDLDAIVCEGARRMLAAALEAEVDDYLAASAAERDERGRRLVVRNGHARQRQVTTAAGAVAVRAPRVDDRRVDPVTGERLGFRSVILPPWCRKSPKVAEVLPLRYLHGLSTGDLVPALEVFFGRLRGVLWPGPGRPRRCVHLGRRHRAPRGAICTGWRWKDSAAGLSQQAGEAEGSLIREAPGRVEAALTTTGRVGTARRPGSGKRDGKVNVSEPVVEPPQAETPAPTWWMWAGQQCTRDLELGRATPGRVIPAPVGRPRGRSAAYSWRCRRGRAGHRPRRPVRW